MVRGLRLGLEASVGSRALLGLGSGYGRGLRLGG